MQRLELERESNLLRLRHSLLDGSYTPGPHRTFTIRHPKPRLIAAAPFEDRVVQHALCNVTQPFLERSFIADTYAAESRPVGNESWACARTADDGQDGRRATA